MSVPSNHQLWLWQLPYYFITTPETHADCRTAAADDLLFRINDSVAASGN